MTDITRIKELIDSFDFICLSDEYSNLSDLPPHLPYVREFIDAKKIANGLNDENLLLDSFNALSTLELLTNADSSIVDKILFNENNFKNFCLNINDLETYLALVQKINKPTITNYINNRLASLGKNTKIPLRLLPSFLLKNPTFIKSYAKANNVSLDLVEVLLTDEYDEFTEQKILETLKVKSIDDYLRAYIDLGPNMNDLTLEDIVVLKLLSLKQLSVNSPETKINFNNYNYISGAATQEGSYLNTNKGRGVYMIDDDSVNVSLLFTNSAEDTVITTIHESEHAEQHKLTQSGSVNINPKVLLFSMDNFIWDCFEQIKSGTGESYYKENYLNYSSEFDAEKNALSRLLKITHPNSEDPLYDFLREIIPGLVGSNYDKEQLLANNIRYQETASRSVNNHSVHIEDLFLLMANNRIKNTSPEEVIAYMQKHYPTLLYRYTLDTGGLRKKSAEELVHDYEKADSPEMRDKMAAIILSTLDKHYTKGTEIPYNQTELNTAISCSPLYQELSDIVEKRIIPGGLGIPGGPNGPGAR